MEKSDRTPFADLFFLQHPENRYRPKGVFGKGVGNSKHASEMRQKCVKMGLVLLGKEERSKMRQKCVKIASKMRGTPLGETTFWTIPRKTRPEKSSRKSPGKSSKRYTKKNSRHMPAERPGLKKAFCFRENQTCTDLRAIIPRHVAGRGRTVDSYRRSCRNSRISHRKGGCAGAGRGPSPFLVAQCSATPAHCTCDTPV